MKITKHIDNYDFISHIIKIKCVRCGEYFEPDKTKPIKSTCENCKRVENKPDKKKYANRYSGLSEEKNKERLRKYHREYSREYYRKNYKSQNPEDQ